MRQYPIGRLLAPVLHLANKRVQDTRIHAGLAIILSRKFQGREAILVGSKTTIGCLVQVDEPAFNGKEDQRRFRRIICDDQCVSLAGGFVDESPRLGNPFMFQVSPVATYRKAPNRADVVVRAQRGAGETL